MIGAALAFAVVVWILLLAALTVIIVLNARKGHAFACPLLSDYFFRLEYGFDISPGGTLK